MRLLSLTLLATLFLALPATAQVSEGLFELRGSAAFSSTEGTTVLQFSPQLGYFFTNAIEAGVGLDYIKIENIDGQGSLTLFAAYHFGRRGATTVPFLEASLGTSLTEDSDLVFGGSGGLKVFFLPGGALTGEVFVLTSGDITTVGVAGGVAIFF
jgi:hypothetical protein